MDNGNEPAYPTSYEGRDGLNVWVGITKREHFAAMAMQGIVSNPHWSQEGPFQPHAVAASAVEYADALLSALNTGE